MHSRNVKKDWLRRAMCVETVPRDLNSIALALDGRVVAKLLAVLHDGAARERDAPLFQQRAELLVRQRLLGVLTLDETLDDRLGLSRGDVLPVSVRALRDVKRLRSATTPVGSSAYLLATARLTVDSCTPMVSATSFIVIGSREAGPFSK